MRKINYGTTIESVNEYVRVSENTAMKYLKTFCRTVIEKFESEYIRIPTNEELKKYRKKIACVGFLSCIGCLDCSGWEWLSFPRALKGIIFGKEKSQL